MSKRSKRQNAGNGSDAERPPRLRSEVSGSVKPSQRGRRKEGARFWAGSSTRNAQLPARHQGRVKAYARDVVDHQHHLLELFWPTVIIVLLLLLVLPIQFFELFIIALGFLATIVVQGIFFGRQVMEQAKERFPKEHITGTSLGRYAIARASRLRVLRVPRPRARIGDKV